MPPAGDVGYFIVAQWFNESTKSLAIPDGVSATFSILHHTLTAIKITTSLRFPSDNSALPPRK